MATDDADQMLRDFERRIDDQLVQADRVRTELEAVRATAHGHDGAVEVTVDSSGALADLHLTTAALRLRPEELSGEILATARRAQAQLAERMSALINGILGPDSETARFVSDTYQERFPPPPEAADTDAASGGRGPAPERGHW